MDQGGAAADPDQALRVLCGKAQDGQRRAVHPHDRRGISGLSKCRPAPQTAQGGHVPGACDEADRRPVQRRLRGQATLHHAPRPAPHLLYRDGQQRDRPQEPAVPHGALRRGRDPQRLHPRQL